MVKLEQKITAFQAMEACHNLCARIKAGIKGTVHASKRGFGRKTPPNAVLSDSHPKEENVLKTIWEGVP